MVETPEFLSAARSPTTTKKRGATPCDPDGNISRPLAPREQQGRGEEDKTQERARDVLMTSLEVKEWLSGWPRHTCKEI